MVRYSAKELEERFRGSASVRTSQKKTGKSEYANDAGYWDGGYCNWGGTHNLAEDCERLAEFFTGITELRNARKELLTFNNQQEFEKNKQNLLNKTTNAISGLNMKTSSNTSIGGVCIIWADFVSFWKSKLDEFCKELELLKTDIERVAYNEAKELQKLLSDERKIKNEIEENERRARNETDENKKKQFIFLVDEAKENLKKTLERKKQLKSAGLGDDFNPDQHIDNFLKVLEDKLSGKNRPPRPNRSQQSTFNFNTNNSSSFTPNSLPSLNDERSFLERYWKELLLISFFLGGCYYIYNQNEETN